MFTVPAFGPWPESIHQDEKQRQTLARAQKRETSPVSVDPEAQTGVFYGSGKNPYQTSLASCTCNDFVRRKLPCKHIYRLAMELGIIDLPHETGLSKGERNEIQISLADSVALIEKLPEAAQRHIEQMLCATSDRVEHRQQPILCDDPVVANELRTCTLLHENPFPVDEVLSRMKKNELLSIIDGVSGDEKPKRNAAKAALADWIKANVPDLPAVLPPAASFSFIVNFDKAQPSVYKYLLRKYENETDFLTGAVYPHGSILLTPDEYVFYFPGDEITALLTKYGCNRCLNGYAPEK